MTARTFILILFPIGALISFQTYDLKESMARGKELYALECQHCHLPDGKGIANLYPPVANTDYLKKDPGFLIDIILKGQTGEIIVNGEKYNTPMPAQDYLSDEKVADILNYIRNNWKNKGAVITPAQVKKQRKM